MMWRGCVVKRRQDLRSKVTDLKVSIPQEGTLSREVKGCDARSGVDSAIRGVRFNGDAALQLCMRQ